jgi:sulfate/thiosulfate transport system substrate-binding protein
MPVKARNLLIALILPAAVAVAGCGGASDEKGEAAASGGSGEKATLSLVAYSTPRSSMTS